MRLYLAQPVSGRVSSPFGAPRSYGGHVGADFAVPTGAPVRSAAAGRVVASGWISNDAGIGVKVDHGGGLTTVYFHLSRNTVNVSELVSAGQVSGCRTRSKTSFFGCRTLSALKEAERVM